MPPRVGAALVTAGVALVCGCVQTSRSSPPALYTTLSGMSPVTSKYTFPLAISPCANAAG